MQTFDRLPEAAKREVAERLLKIEESGWKPFWCPRSNCDGMPHVLPMVEGMDPTQPGVDLMYMPASADEGPNGEPLGKVEQVAGGFYRPVLDARWAHNHARADQRLPPWKKKWTLFIMSGRGAGKTRTGVEFVTLNARKGLDGAIVGRRGTELENTHVAEILKHAHPEFTPEYKASKDILVWPNGAITYLFSAERPENIRSVNLSYCWFDEAAWMDEIEKAWDNAKFATRVKSEGNPIHFLITSTPTGTPWVMTMEDDEDVTVRRVSTYANRDNLDAEFLADLEKRYEGTRTGRQELHGEVLRDVEGALWNDDMMLHHRAATPDEFENWVDSMDERVAAIDPAGSKGPRSDATGIIGVGTQRTETDGTRLRNELYWVLGDATLKGTPTQWARRAFKFALSIKAHKIMAEKNFGGDMVKQVLDDFAEKYPEDSLDHNGEKFTIEVKHAVLSKETRAEATVGKYEQGRVTHLTHAGVFGDLSKLEKEQTTWVPKSRGGRLPSPNRIDALVWAMRALETAETHEAQTATSRDAMSRLKNGPVAARRNDPMNAVRQMTRRMAG